MKHLFNFILFTSVLLLAANSAEAQNKWAARMPRKVKVEAAVFLGASNYEGTLEENLINYNYTLPGFGAMIRYNFTNKFALRAGMDYGTIEDDDYTATEDWRKERNLSFKTSILDGYVAGEYYFATWSDRYKKFSQLYILGGIGSFHFNPQAEYMGKWYDLQPLHTEGQATQEYPNRQPYSLNQVYIPFGVGIRFTLDRNWFLNLEIRANKTFTDYLDDVSLTYASPDVLLAYGGPIAEALGDRTAERYPDRARDVTGQSRGSNAGKDDWFFFTGFTLSYSFRPKLSCGGF